MVEKCNYHLLKLAEKVSKLYEDIAFQHPDIN